MHYFVMLSTRFMGQYVVAIGNASSFVLSYEDVVVALLSKDMRKSMEDTSKDALTIRGHYKKTETSRSSNRSKSRHRSRSRERSGIRCWRCAKSSHMKKDCK